MRCINIYAPSSNYHVIPNLGRFTRNDLVNIWKEAQYASMHDELLQLMLKFRLCYQLPGNLDTFIAPQLLTENQPVYDWDETDNILMRYAYEFMPKAILTQFIVVLHALIDHQRLVWRSGGVLAKNQTQAEIIVYYGQREIRIRVAGKHKKELLTIVTYELEKIHATYRRLKYNQLIPCNCVMCRVIQNPEFYPYEVLRKFMEDGKTNIQCRKSYKMVDVRRLIDDVIMEKGSFDKESKRVFMKMPLDGNEMSDGRKKDLQEYQQPMETVMGDKIVITGKGVVVTRGSQGHDIQFQEIWNLFKDQIDLEVMVKELELLKKHLKEEAVTEEQFEVAKNVAAAEREARTSNGPKMLEYLKKGWVCVLKKADEVGTKLIVEVINKAIGI